ncbi:murein biosynthesis integral membrane protein MurJ [Nocardioides sp. AE5]|uniref:murein biosynthesis integral membrane protein MurJ n=1 Tax=Nocardioides sp. AE5 TaxID=2962573 RepID=UPI002882AFB0|nr:murein biosynthesis integral membrane protein MurJ [Nocardioides sp. AE5]MDT0202432.1 murein biosynthesis integral membrane protein MurJ [Nocardioides sp. AE5]
MSAQRSVMGHSAIMAAGTIVSRFSGLIRSILLAAALGTAAHADLFTIANTIPNMLYILLAGGVFNAVLVPQLVRAMRNDADGGEAYTNRIITLAALFLGVVTVLLVVCAPWVMELYLDQGHQGEARQSVIDFARYCLPQVFFYGMFVLIGQVLNARGSFGPMMWAPIANNVISVGVLVVYLLVFGPSSVGAYSTSQELLLGVGSTLGIAAQFLILLPYLRAAGFTYRPRFDFRGSGLGHTLRLGTWTVLFVVVNQVAYTVVVRLASSGTADAGDGTGYTIYSGAFLLVTVPHGIITVSLATAVLPLLSRAAADHDLAGLSRSLAETLRACLAFIVPFVMLLPLLAGDVARVVWGYGAASETYTSYAPTVALFAPGILFFTIHYLMLRGFYSLERTRTVFWVQCVIAVVNIGLAVVLVGLTSAKFTSPALALSYGGAYAVGAATSYLVLRRVLGGLDTLRNVRFLVRTALAGGLAASAAYGVARLLDPMLGGSTPNLVQSLGFLAAIAVVDGVLFLLLARLMRITEVTVLIATVARRLPGGSRFAERIKE